MRKAFIRRKRDLVENHIPTVLLIGLLIVIWLFPTNTNAIEIGYTNPPRGDINTKLETIARKKGIPSLVLKAIAFRESSWRQWDSNGKPILSSPTPSNPTHPAIGIMQIASYDDKDTALIAKLMNDIDFNIAYGADILNQKWAMTPKIGNGERNILENWYYAIWAYNYWIKDGNSKNNPHQVTNGQITYQDSVLNLCAANFIPSVPGAINPIVISRPSLTDIPLLGVPTPIPTPTPFHYGDLAQDGSGELEKTLEFKRLAGDDRIATAVSLAQEGWPSVIVDGATPRKVVLARSDDFADALAGVPLAAKYDAPILITPPHKMDNRVLAEILREQPQEIILLGAEGALGSEIVNTLLENGFSKNQLTRIQGSDRYETAAAIADQVGTTNGSAYIVTGENFPDALGVASVAGRNGTPIILMPSNRLHPSSLAVLQRLKVQQVKVLGFGLQAYEQMNNAIQGQNPTVQISSIRGEDRYATTVSVLENDLNPATEVYLTTGENFPDALAGAAFTAHRQAILLLIPESHLEAHSELINYLKSIGPGIKRLGVLGSPFVIKDNIIDQVKGYILNSV